MLEYIVHSAFKSWESTKPKKITPPQLRHACLLFSFLRHYLRGSIYFCDLVRRGAPVCLDLDLELCQRDPKQFQQRRLITVEFPALLTDGIRLIEHDLALVQPRRHAPFPDRDLQRMRQRHIILGPLLPSPTMHHPLGHRKRPRRHDPGPRKINLDKLLKKIQHLPRLAVGVQQPDIPLEIARQFRQAGGMFGLRIDAQRLGHDLGFPVEDAAVAEVLPHVLEVGVAHVLDAKDKGVRVGVGRLVHGVEERRRALLAGLFLDLRGVHDAGALGFGHGGGGGGGGGGGLRGFRGSLIGWDMCGFRGGVLCVKFELLWLLLLLLLSVSVDQC